jgi:acyl carrier protein
MVKAIVAEYLESQFLFKFDAEITDTTNLFEAGIIDSHGYVSLMHFLQSTFAIRFSREELLSNVITHLSGLVACVERKIQLAKEQGVSNGAAPATK